MKEVEELAECTFKPQINPWPSKEAESGVQIKGVQRHLELQRLAKQIKFDRAEWEKKIFFSQVSYRIQLTISCSTPAIYLFLCLLSHRR